MGRGSSKVGGGGGAVTKAKYEKSVNDQLSKVTEKTRTATITAVDTKGNEREATINRSPVYAADQVTVKKYNYGVVYENRGINPGSMFSMTFDTLPEAKKFVKDMFEVD